MTHAPRTMKAVLATAALAAVAALAGCGGGNPLANPNDVSNPEVTGSQKLSYAYFQQCVFPIYKLQLQSVGGVNSCASSGCHDNVNGTGGALRLYPAAVAVDLADAANTPAVIRNSDMYKNFYSSLAATIPGAPTQSRLFQKPLVLNTLHGGGQIFERADDAHAKVIAHWIENPMPRDQDEFSVAGNALFSTGTDPCQPQ